MSRPTKLLITVLFLVLLSIPAVYLFLSWKPGNHLRFQVVSVTSGGLHEGHRNYPCVLEFTVTNTARVPVLLHFARPAQMDPKERPDYLLDHASNVTIPAGHAVRFTRPITENLRDDILAPDPVPIQYYCSSRAQRFAADTRIRLYHTLPPKYHWLLPTLEMTMWTTPLQPASPPAPTALKNHQQSPTDSPEGLPPPAPRVDNLPR